MKAQGATKGKIDFLEEAVLINDSRLPELARGPVATHRCGH
jgi:hypothetical protein